MEEVLEFLQSNIRVIDNDYFVVGVSGGVDSMVLLYFLRNIYPNINIVCAHVHHNLRKESDEEAIFVEQYCKKNNIVFEMYKIDNYDKGHFTEDEARKKRYKFFDSIMIKYNAKYLFTAHHADDLIETILLKLSRGASFYGYRGFSDISKRDKYQIVRPFIYISKDKIRKYALSNNISYREDYTNSDAKYLRNKYRMKILPILKENNEKIYDNFLAFSKIIEEYQEYFDDYTDKLFNNYYRDNKFPIDIILSENQLMQKQIIYHLLRIIYKNSFSIIKEEHVLNIIKLIGNKKINGYINLPNNYLCIREYNNLYIKENECFSEYNIELRNVNNLHNGRQILVLKECNDTDNNVTYLNSETIKLPLYIRTRKDGDKIMVKNFNHEKKVKEIFIENKIPFTLRKSWPIVVDSDDRIIWIPGLKKSKFDSKNQGKYDIILKYI